MKHELNRKEASVDSLNEFAEGSSGNFFFYQKLIVQKQWKTLSNTAQVGQHRMRYHRFSISWAQQMLRAKFSWYDYFTEPPVTTIDHQEYNSRQTYSDLSVYVIDCLLEMAVPFIAHLIICLLNHPLSSHAIQIVVMEEPFTSIVAVMVNVFWKRYVGLIVI